MRRRRSWNRGSRFARELYEVHEIGLDGLVELQPLRPSPAARWWRAQPGLAKAIYWLLAGAAAFVTGVAAWLIVQP